MLGQLTDTVGSHHGDVPHHTHGEVTALRYKIKTLEKDLYYYKKTSRDLKQQLHRNRAAERAAIKHEETAVKRVERVREKEERVPVGEGKHITLQDSLDSEG